MHIELPKSLRLNYLSFLAILLSTFLPTLYATFRIYLLGELPGGDTFDIVSQNMWIQLFYEIFYEGMMFPLYYLLGTCINRKSVFDTRLTLAFIIFCGVYFLLSGGILFFSNMLLNGMDLTPELQRMAQHYIHLEIIATALSSLFLFNNLILYLIDAKKFIYVILVLQVFLSMLFDLLFVSRNAFSLDLGVIGVAYTKIAVNLSLILVFLAFKKSLSIQFSLQNWKHQMRWLTIWLQKFLVSGGESFVRNIIFILMILRMVNTVHESGSYWLANQFIWGWLLVPILALSTLIKIDVAKHEGKIGNRLNGYFLVSIVFIFCWFASMPWWQDFLINVMNIKEFKTVLSLSYLLIGFYVFFALRSVLESYFYGIGRIDLVLYQTLIVNIVYYGTAFILYVLDYIYFDLTTLAYLFGGGLIFSTLVTIALWYKSGCHLSYLASSSVNDSN